MAALTGRPWAQPVPLATRLPHAIAEGFIAGLIGWVVSGYAVFVPVTVVAIVSVQAAMVDARTLRIPNTLVAAVLAAVAAGAPLAALADQRSLGDVAVGVAAGVVLGGAPLLFALWLIRPASVGGGDWKLLTAQSAAIGLLAPYAAPLVLLGGGVGGLVQRVFRRRCPHVPLGPGLAVGYVAAMVAALAFPEYLGGPYTWPS